MRVGEVYETSKYGNLMIIKYVSHKKVYVKFLNTGYETETCFGNVKKGVVKDRSTATVYGVGVVGEEPTKIRGVHEKEYRMWKNMLERCYSEDFLMKNRTYANCKASDNFKHYPYFKEWCNNQIGFGNEGWELDKDILVKGNKVYGEDTCCFVPREVNTLFIVNKKIRGALPVGVYFNKANQKFVSNVSKGSSTREYLGSYLTPEEAFYVYKQAKEAYIKEVANKWKDKIDPRVYEALMNWEVDIDD